MTGDYIQIVYPQCVVCLACVNIWSDGRNIVSDLCVTLIIAASRYRI